MKNSVLRVIRGGSRISGSRWLRFSFRNGGEPEFRFRDNGFRIAVRRRAP